MTRWLENELFMVTVDGDGNKGSKIRLGTWDGIYYLVVVTLGFMDL